MVVQFVGYFHAPKTDMYRAEFAVLDHPFLPAGVYVDWDFLRKSKIAIPVFPNYSEWCRAEFKKRAAVHFLLKPFLRFI